MLADSQGKVVVAPDNGEVGRILPQSTLNTGTKIMVGGQTVGTLLMPDLVTAQDALQKEYLQPVNRALWLAGLAGGAIAILLSFVLLRCSTTTLRELDAATREIPRRQLHQHIQVRSNDELGHLAQPFNEMAASLERTEDVKRNMISDIAHELRTPLSNLRGGLEGLYGWRMDSHTGEFCGTA